MTLILSVMTSGATIQVSDRRLTRPNGEIFDDESNKAVVVECLNARFSVAYTGLAYLGPLRTDLRTDNWLTSTLESLKPHKLTVEEVLPKLSERLEHKMQVVGAPQQRKGLSVVCTGFFYRPDRRLFHEFAPFTAVISNQINSSGQYKRVEEAFRVYISSLDSNIPSRYWAKLRVDGNTLAVTHPLLRRFRKLKRHVLVKSRDTDEIMSSLVGIIRAAAHTEEANGTVGDSCMGVLLPHTPTHHYHSQYFPPSKSPTYFRPHQVGMGAATIRNIKTVVEADGVYKVTFEMQVDEFTEGPTMFIHMSLPE